MTLMRPEGVKAQGNSHIAVVPDLDPDAVSVATIKGAGSVTMTCYLYGTGLAANAETNKGSKPARACDDSEIEVSGRTKYTLEDLQISYDPQGEDDDNENAAKTAMEPGATVWLVERLGLSAKNTDWAVGQKVVLHHVSLQARRRTKTGDDEFAEFSITQAADYVDSPTEATLVA